MGGLTSETTETDIKEYFSVYGTLTDVVVMKGERASSLGCSWVGLLMCGGAGLTVCFFSHLLSGRCGPLETDKLTGNGRGFGFVTFEDMNGACTSCSCSFWTFLCFRVVAAIRDTPT